MQPASRCRALTASEISARSVVIKDAEGVVQNRPLTDTELVCSKLLYTRYLTARELQDVQIEYDNMKLVNNMDPAERAATIAQKMSLQMDDVAAGQEDIKQGQKTIIKNQEDMQQKQAAMLDRLCALSDCIVPQPADAQPDAAQRDAAQPTAAHTAAAQPDAAQQPAAQPPAAHTAALQPDTAQPTAAHTAAAQPDTAPPAAPVAHTPAAQPTAARAAVEQPDAAVEDDAPDEDAESSSTEDEVPIKEYDAQPPAAQPDAAQPGAAQPDAALTESPAAKRRRVSEVADYSTRRALTYTCDIEDTQSTFLQLLAATRAGECGKLEFEHRIATQIHFVCYAMMQSAEKLKAGILDEGQRDAWLAVSRLAKDVCEKMACCTREFDESM